MKRFLLAAASCVFLWNSLLTAQEPRTPQLPPPRRGVPNPDAEQLTTPGSLVELGFRDFKRISTNIRPVEAALPSDYSREIFREVVPDAPRDVPITEFYWEAPEIWYRPLYFDDVQLERYGQTPCPPIQPVLSGAHFFGSLVLLPYKMGIDPPHGYVTNLGYYRPGSPAPCVGRRLPWERDAAAIETATVVGLFLLLP